MEIRIDGLRKTFGAAVAINNIDLVVPEGKMLVLLGPSGCGKTTTMRCVAGLEEPDSGRVTIGGRATFDAARGINTAIHKRNVGMVFQSYAIWPHMTVAQNVAYPLDMANTPGPEKRQRVNEMLEVVGLAGLGERGASYLSGGQMQRVALARSLVMRPSVLLFDEPLSNLDARLRDNLRVQLRELQMRFGITSVYVTHDQREAMALADEIAIMRKGAIAQIGDPVSLYRGPATSEIANFLGYSNIFPVEAIEPGGMFTARAGGALLRPTNEPASAATALAVCARPEDISVRALKGSIDSQSVNMIAGEVTLASFMGATYQYRVRAPSGDIWEAMTPFDGAAFRPGDRVALEMAPSSILVLPCS